MAGPRRKTRADSRNDTFVRSRTLFECLDDVIPTGWAEIDAALGGGIRAGALHEWYGLADALSGASNERRSNASWTPPVCPLVHLAWQALKADEGSRWTVWIGRRVFPYPGVLVRAGGADRRLLQRSIFVAPSDTNNRLWAIDLALRSSAVGVVIADGSAFTMAATRRIQLVAKANRTAALLVRPPWERHELSAAQSRWLVKREPSFVEGVIHPASTGQPVLAGREQVRSRRNGRAFDERPRWSVELLRCKGVQPEQTPRVWALEWDRAKGTVGISASMADPAGDTTTPETDRAITIGHPRSA